MQILPLDSFMALKQKMLLKHARCPWEPWSRGHSLGHRRGEGDMLERAAQACHPSY
ncbi:mCG1032075 [Mus musculus]|nr:mCG1032075 [Mus musculus]